jgi:shikimate dehydrogenase
MSAGFRLAGVMGWPIAHSRSPALHGHWLAQYGIAGAYVPLAVRPEHLQEALRALPALGFAGCNLTVPHKEAALAVLDHIDPAARRIGSVNTVVVRPDGGLEGFSTDGYGFIENLRQQARLWNPAAGPAVVLGAGGSARAIVAALLDIGVQEVRLVNRTEVRARTLAQDLGGAITPWVWSQRTAALEGAGLLVNTTTQGMTGEAPLDLDITGLPPGAVVADIVYVPLETPLLAAARAKGHVGVDGLGMLLHQARPGFAAWFGAKPTVDDALRQAVLATFGK